MTSLVSSSKSATRAGAPGAAGGPAILGLVVFSLVMYLISIVVSLVLWLPCQCGIAEFAGLEIAVLEFAPSN